MERQHYINSNSEAPLAASHFSGTKAEPNLLFLSIMIRYSHGGDKDEQSILSMLCKCHILIFDQYNTCFKEMLNGLNKSGTFSKMYFMCCSWIFKNNSIKIFQTVNIPLVSHFNVIFHTKRRNFCC